MIHKKNYIFIGVVIKNAVLWRLQTITIFSYRNGIHGQQLLQLQQWRFSQLPGLLVAGEGPRWPTDGLPHGAGPTKLPVRPHDSRRLRHFWLRRLLPLPSGFSPRTGNDGGLSRLSRKLHGQRGSLRCCTETEEACRSYGYVTFSALLYGRIHT